MSPAHTVAPCRRVSGAVYAPPDKSISHRAAMLAAYADGPSLLRNFLKSADCLATLNAVRALGVPVHEQSNGDLLVRGAGPQQWISPKGVLDLGNSGTGSRLLTGLLCARPGLQATITGDDSLRRRPMKRILEPLARMGADIQAEAGDKAPLTLRGKALKAIAYALPVASAQVKSAILLAALQAQGKTEIEEPAPTRDHTERMIAYMGGNVQKIGNRVALQGPQALQGKEIHVPGDISSAFFLMAAALITPGASLTVRHVCLNPTRIGILDVLKKMGARIVITPCSDAGPEPVGDLQVSHGPLRGLRLDNAALIPNIIDEIPMLAVLAARAEGITEIRHAKELRVKETDRIAAIGENLGAVGVRAEEFDDGLRVYGGAAFRGAKINSHQDHRIAMAFAIAGLCAEGPVTVSDTEFIDTSFPGFFDMLKKITR